MAKVLRLNTSGLSNDISDWGNSTKYSSKIIDSIVDPDGATSKKEITSIPSPFARIDLVKTAFKQVVTMANKDIENLNGKTIFHKMVSDSLDIAEILFKYENYSDKVKIIVWDRKKHLEELLNSPQNEHKIVGRTLDTFLKDDAPFYNFNQMERIYLLNYIGPDKPDSINIIGATSPVTLFFSSANNLDFVSKNIMFDGNDRPFDDEFKPLYKRDFELQKYLYYFRNSVQNFAKLFEDVFSYLQLNYSKLSFEQQKEIDTIDTIDATQIDSDFSQISIDAANSVEILGYYFHKQKDPSDLKSDFEILRTINEDVKNPLVLPIEPGIKYQDLKYTSQKWNKEFKAEFFDPLPINERRLPHVGIAYPYLTISDFLSDTLIRMPYKLNSEFYFSGNYQSNDAESYLLPVTDLFFNYFTANDLRSQMPDGKKMLEITNLASGASVTLRIPIKNDKYIEYRRLYFTGTKPDLASNSGAIISKSFGFGIVPFVSYPDTVTNKDYRFALFDKGEKDITLSVMNGLDEIPILSRSIRDKKAYDEFQNIAGCEIDVLKGNFDHVKVNIGTTSSGIIVPIFRNNAGAQNYTFAIDFGTTNTHVEYSIGGGVSHTFDVNANEIQLRKLHSDYLIDKNVFNKYFIDNLMPDCIIDEYTFPQRTAFSESKSIDYLKPTNVLADGNIPFNYEKAPKPTYNNILTNLKWSTRKNSNVQMKLYIENLCCLIRNKVLFNSYQCKLDDTKIIWFYPSSMSNAQRGRLQRIWEENYEAYFGNNMTNLISISESYAPYKYYTRKKVSASNIVTVDVGGGTTDIFVVEDNKPQLYSSFRFGANCIFGDAYNFDSDMNGFVQRYLDEIKDVIIHNEELDELLLTYKSIEEMKVSSDIITFMFSLSQNNSTKNIPQLDFSTRLSDDRQEKIILAIYYAALFYYVATTMKAARLKKPNAIAFSGNGSKTLKILTQDTKVQAKFIQLIFEKVYKEPYQTSEGFEVVMESQPKKATCIGGIMSVGATETIDDEIKKSLLGIDDTTFIDNKKTYGDLTDADKISVETSVSNFFQFFVELHTENRNFYEKNFDIDNLALDFVKKNYAIGLKDFLNSGINQRLEEEKGLGKGIIIEDTLFFYPLVGILNKLAREINKEFPLNND
jgi:hypothetical protein